MTVKKNPYLELREIPLGYVNVMGYVEQSEVNGPGCLAVVWVQGCLRECPGCFNPQSWSLVHIFKDGSRIVTGFWGNLNALG